ncbi:hypothetical protein IQ06DRAFT_294329 [Phaeosphaeriaceae sp. SRC1lsM3a]|nr:hypothetical protein IQ06DRAFT_294329 [Stagonospora sp. SRC1lsM3a]
MSRTSSNALTSKLGHLKPSRSTTTTTTSSSSSDRTALVEKREADFLAEQKHKELIMKYRNMSAEEVEKYLAEKKEKSRSSGGKTGTADAWIGLSMSLSCA